MIFEDPSHRRWRKVVGALSVVISLCAFILANVMAWFLLDISGPDIGQFEKEYAKNSAAAANKTQAAASKQAPKPQLAQNQKWPNPLDLTKRISKLRQLPPIRERFPPGETVTAKPAENPSGSGKDGASVSLSEKAFVQVAFQETEASEAAKSARAAERPLLHAGFLRQSEVPYPDAIAQYVGNLDVVFPDWFSLGSADCSVSETIDWSLYDLIKKDPVTLPTFSDKDGDPSRFSAVIRDKGKSKCLISELKRAVEKRSVPGIDLDISDLQPQDRDFYTAWLLSLTEAFHDDGLYVAANVPMDNFAYDYARIGRIADIVVVRGFDEHAKAGDPGPVAGLKWFASNLERLKGELSGGKKAKVIVALWSYAYDWNTSAKTAPETMSFYSAMSLAKSVRADVRMGADSKNGTFTYVDANGEKHEVWFQDATNVWNERYLAKQDGAYGVALSRIGLEDASIWEFFSSANQRFDPTDLSDLPNSEYPVSTGKWKAFRIVKIPTSGFRSLSVSGSIIEAARYQTLPQNVAIERYGLNGTWSGTIALMFDEDPDPEYMDELMSLLEKYGVHATFFVMQKDPSDRSDFLKRAYEDQHVIAGVAPSDLDRPEEDMRSFSLSVGSAMGHLPLLFKTTGDIGKGLALWELTGSGYLLMSADFDSWGLENPNPDSLLSDIETRVKNDPSRAVAVHISSGNKDGVLASLDSVIPVLLKKGYRFVSANELLGVSRDAIMPEMSWLERYANFWRNFFLGFASSVVEIIGLIFASATIACVFRLLFMGTFVVRSFKMESYVAPHDFQPPVTVLVPAYNEEKVIERTIAWLLRSDYPEFEILVIDDGSKDGTSAKVTELSVQYPNVRLITKKNEGKSLALNLGFQEAKYDYIITVDADTIVLTDTLRRLMEPFAMPGVDAVCGNINVGNVKNILTAFQEVEYVTWQNFDKRAFDALNCISVVPGATGAWKKQKVLEIGGYESDTLVEDADLTLTLLEHGGRVVFAPLAKSITEAPETVKALYKQRFRWSYGTFQCFWKHRGTIGKGMLGIVALPNMIFSQVIFNALSPVGDAVFLYAVLTGEHISSIALWYGVFLLVDLVVTAGAYALERKSLKNLWVVCVQRFFYRQFMYTVTFASLLAAIRGSRHGWNKLERKGTVQLVDGPEKTPQGMESLGVRKSF